MPNGLASAPLYFTRLLKKKGHLSVGYIDDSYLQASTQGGSVHNIYDTVSLFGQLGLMINSERSVTECLTYLGFILY